MSIYTNTVCAWVVNTLARLNKEILTTDDVRTALKRAGVGSKGGMKNYTDDDGYLTEGEWLTRCIGGWAIPAGVVPTRTITINVTPGKAAGQVFSSVGKALETFKGFTVMEMEA